jgi:hypothetical protein
MVRKRTDNGKEGRIVSGMPLELPEFSHCKIG